ncbi:MAG: SDR family NAD(P)-dependent oxidoreductase [Burkholderiales bacterium]|nr:SDR family NAD(P)-dependent oxidoreductase [Burkholderiales bacterium]
MTLKNRTALVTGSTQGIGLAIAQALAQEGANIVLHGIEEAGQGEAISTDLATRFGVQAAYVRANLAKAEEAEQLVAVASQALGAPDILVNNAGIQYTCGIESFPAERWDAILAVNRAAFPPPPPPPRPPRPRARQGGGPLPPPPFPPPLGSGHKGAYLAAKHGLVGLSKGVALETATQGIAVNCICPGWTDTPPPPPPPPPPPRPRPGPRGAPGGGGGWVGGETTTPNPPSPRRAWARPALLRGGAAARFPGGPLPVDGGWTAQ